MEPLNIEKALKGHPVRLRNGEKAYIRYVEKEFQVSRRLVGYRETSSGDYVLTSWYKLGKGVGPGNLDIVGMWKSAPLVFLYWGEIKRVFNYIAKDQDGEWFAYADKPTKRDGDYYTRTSCASLGALSNKIFPDCDWKDSLLERPR